MEISEETYMDERLNSQIKWYDQKSRKYQKIYKWLKGIQIVLSASIPLLVGLVLDHNYLVTIIGVIGIIITAIEGILSITKYQENWIEYRSICETLKHEKYMYLTRTGVYHTMAPFKFFVERVESIISNENVNWASLNKDDDDAK